MEQKFGNGKSDNNTDKQKNGSHAQKIFLVTLVLRLPILFNMGELFMKGRERIATAHQTIYFLFVNNG